MHHFYFFCFDSLWKQLPLISRIDITERLLIGRVIFGICFYKHKIDTVYQTATSSAISI